MCLQQFTKILFINIIFTSCFFSFAADTTAAHDPTRVQVQSPYKTEYSPWFKFSSFQRGFFSDSLSIELDRLEEVPRETWTRNDSLNFARASLRTGNISLSEYYFNHLNISYQTEETFWWDQMILFILNHDYEGGIDYIHKTSPGIIVNSKIYFLDRFLQSYLANEADSKWYKTNVVLKWELDSTLLKQGKNSSLYNSRIIKPLNNLNFVLKKLIHFIHEEDPIIAKACFEMGIIIEKNVSLTQGYIAYSLGRHYNKWDKEILQAVKAVKVKLSERKYKIPIFRRYFPRIEYWRFDFDVLKERVYLQKQDTIPKSSPQIIFPKEETSMPVPIDLILIGGIFLLFLLVLLFLRTKK